jgi:hypothetical protein
MKTTRRAAVSIVLFALAACGGKVVAEGSRGTGSGGAGGAGTGGAGQGGSTAAAPSTADGLPIPTTVSGTVTVAVAVSSTTGGTGACDPSYHCAEAIDLSTGDPSKLCDGTVSAKLYDTLASCVCMGNCAAICGNNACVGQDISAACQACVIKASLNGGCGDEFNACSNDV